MFNRDIPNHSHPGTNPRPRPEGFKPPSRPTSFPPLWERRSLELLVRAN
jgi:hypothetical protein